MAWIKRFWSDEQGVVVSLEIVLTTAVLGFGMLAGLQVLRDALAQELVDLGNAVSTLNSSLSGSNSTPTPVSLTLGVAPQPESP